MHIWRTTPVAETESEGKQVSFLLEFTVQWKEKTVIIKSIYNWTLKASQGDRQFPWKHILLVTHFPYSSQFSLSLFTVYFHLPLSSVPFQHFPLNCKLNFHYPNQYPYFWVFTLDLIIHYPTTHFYLIDL